MVSVIFTKSQTSKIKNFKKMPFHEACQFTYHLEQEFQDQKETADVDFYLLNEDDDKLYEGTLILGSGYATNLYHHVYNKLTSVQLEGKRQKERKQLLSLLQEEAPDNLKTVTNEVASSIEPRNVYTSRLSRSHRRLIYGAGIFVILFLGVICFVFVSLSNGQAQAISKLQSKLDHEATISSAYQKVLMDQPDAAMAQLSKIDHLTPTQKTIYTNLLIDQKKYKEAIALNDGKADQLEARIFESGDIDALKAFQKVHATPEGTFDVAYIDGDWKSVIGAKDVNMTDKRHAMKAVAYAKLGQFEDAMKEAKLSGNDALVKQISTVEKKKQALDQVNQELEKVKNGKKKDDNKKKIKKLDEKKEKLQKQYEQSLKALSLDES